MFNLIIAIVSVALVVALIAVGNFYGGSAISDADAQAEAARLKTEEQQVLAAADMFNAQEKRWPNDVRELVTAGFLTSVPQGAKELQAKGVNFSVISTAFAQVSVEGWSMPLPGQPIFATAGRLPKEVCRKYNLVSRGDDGILKSPFSAISAQCFGQETYQIVVVKTSAVAALATAVAPVEVVTGGLPGKDTGNIWWDTLPSTDIKAGVDDEKVPYAELNLLPTSPESFGDVQVGQSKGSAARTVINRGNAPAESVAFAVPAGFNVTSSSCTTGLNPGASCSFSITFAPGSAGSFGGAVSVGSSNGGAPSFAVSGMGRTAEDQHALLTIAPESQDFGAVQVGQSATSAAHTLSNSGNIAASGVTITPPAGYSLASNTCGASLAAGANCSFALTFSPAAAQAYSGNVAIASTNAGSAAIALTGTGVAQAATVTNIAFGNRAAGAATDLAATLTNAGVGPLSISVPNDSSTTGAGFAFVSTTCTASLAAGANCTTTVRYTASGVDAATGSLTIVTGAGSKVATLSGQSQQAWLVSSPEALAFGNVEVGSSKTLALALTNNGNVDWNTSVPRLPVGFTAGAGQRPCDTRIAPGATCDVNVTFTPAEGRTYSGYYTVEGSGTPLSAGLAGTGLLSKATLISAAAITLADWYQAGTVTGAFMYRNDGNAPMTLASPALVSPLAVASNTCVGVLPGATCEIAVALALNAHTGGGSSQSFVPEGAGVAPAAATTNWSIYSVIPEWLTTHMTFEGVTVGDTQEQEIWLANRGSVAANWASQSSLTPNQHAGVVSFDFSNCANVTPDALCAVKVRYTAEVANLSVVYSNLHLEFASVVFNTLSVSVAAAPSFQAYQFVGSSPAARTFTILNNTGVAVQIVGYSVINGTVASAVKDNGQSIAVAGSWAAGSALTITVNSVQALIAISLSNGQTIQATLKNTVPRGATITVES